MTKKKQTYRRLAARPRRRLQYDRSNPAADIKELVLRREFAGAEHLIHGRLEHRPVPCFIRKFEFSTVDIEIEIDIDIDIGLSGHDSLHHVRSSRDTIQDGIWIRHHDLQKFNFQTSVHFLFFLTSPCGWPQSRWSP